MESERPSLFISYAHYDGTELARRLAFALSLHVDVFLDQYLQSGPFPEQLNHEIESRKFFLFVMSPYSLRPDGWCIKELRHAQQCNDEGIILARLFANCGQPDLESELQE